MMELKRILIHIRWPLQSLTLLGFLFGVVASRTYISLDLLLGLISWFFLCFGITVFNSYYDKDTSPVAGLEKPPATAYSMLVGSWLMKLFGLIIALFLNKIFVSIYVIGVILSVLYSHEKFRLKSNGYIAVLFNFLIGVMTFIVATSFTKPNYNILLLGSLTAGCFLAAIYLMMQIHQREEDKKRGDISMMVMYGKHRTLVFAIYLMTMAAILSLVTLMLSGINLIYVLILICYFIIILVYSLLWLKRRGNSTLDFRIMNKLTTRISYAANIILLLVYFLEVIIKR